MGFSRQEYWSGLPFPSPGDLPDPGVEPRSPALQADALPSKPPGKSIYIYIYIYYTLLYIKYILLFTLCKSDQVPGSGAKDDTGEAGVVAGETVRSFLNVKDKASHQAGASTGVSHPLVSDCSFSLSEPRADRTIAGSQQLC